MPSLTLIDQNAEDNLHAQRLLNFEERPFRRITKRLLISESLILTPAVQPPVPPPDASVADEAAAAYQAQQQSYEEQRKQWSEEALLDFTAFGSNMNRVQFLLNANSYERDRYAGEKLHIQDTAQTVRDSNTQLRLQLNEAQEIMKVRKSFDDLADQITSNKGLRSRDEQHAAIEKLHVEIAELEREQEEYSKTWVDRREQFGRIVDEGMLMLRLIRDEKEEAERKEDMENMDEEGEASKPGTPRPGTPRAAADGATPLHPGMDDIPGAGFQRVAEHALSTTPFPRGSRAGSAAPDRREIETPEGPKMNGDMHTDIEEGEATEDTEDLIERMDTT